MSAAEKLKWLGERNTDAELTTGAALMLLDVLPQILAVVEAAEKIRGDVPWSTGAEVHNALAALEDALA